MSGGGDGELIKLQGTFVFSQPPAFSEVPRVGESGDPPLELLISATFDDCHCE